jgi:hypothetical protein
MPIKKSNLEQRWYYRIVKVFFILLPLLVITFIFFKGYLTIDISPIDIDAIIEKNGVSIMYAVGGLVLYYVVLKGIWRGFLYVVFGGLEDDTKKKVGQMASVHSSGESTLTPPKKKGFGSVIAILIFMALFYYIYFLYLPSDSVYLPSPSNDSGRSGNKTPACSPPTGCGSLWRCSGSYYVSGVRTSVDACFPSGSRPGDIFYSGWSGTCRQCP